MGLPLPRTHLARETTKSVAIGFLAATVPALASLGGAEAAVVHAVHDVAVSLVPMIFMNALMSALVPTVVTLRRKAPSRLSARPDLLSSLVRPAAIVLSLAAAGTAATIGLIYLAASAFSPTGLAAPGIMLVRAVQAVLVAAILTPLSIALFSPRPMGCR